MNKINRCYQCNTQFEEGQNIYKACDTDQCSYECMNNRYNFIKYYDPLLKSPQDWTDISDFDKFNSEKINIASVNKRKSPLKRTVTSLSIDIDIEIDKSNNISILKIADKSDKSDKTDKLEQNNWFYKVKNCFIMMFLFGIVSCAIFYII